MNEGSQGKRLFGGILMGIGILIAGASGICSIWFLSEPGGLEGGFWQIVLLVGGIPFAFGLVLILIGYFIHRAGKGSPPGGETRF